MALIKCPECKKKVSQIAEVCPRCGFPIKSYGFIEKSKPKRNYKKILRTIGIVFVALSILFIAVAFIIEAIDDYIYEKQIEADKDERGRLFQLSRVNPADIYGLSNENNILGEQIYEILEGYTEGEDYTISFNEYCTIYTFKIRDEYAYQPTFNSYSSYKASFSFGEANLIIYTSPTEPIIDMFEYQFRISNSNGNNSQYLKISNLKNILTTYYDVDPSYTYLGEDGYVHIDNETFMSFFLDDYKYLYHIDWEGKKGNATISIFNFNEEASNICSVIFSNN